MPLLPKTLAVGAACLALATGAAQADTLVSSSASNSISTSVGSVSDSIKRSSDASSDSSRGNDVAAGDYRVEEIAPVPGRPGVLRVALQPVAPGQAAAAFALLLPQAAAERGRLAPGSIVTARQRDWGLEFAAGPAREAFFLVMDDARHRELPSRPVTL